MEFEIATRCSGISHTEGFKCLSKDQLSCASFFECRCWTLSPLQMHAYINDLMASSMDSLLLVATGGEAGAVHCAEVRARASVKSYESVIMGLGR